LRGWFDKYGWVLTLAALLALAVAIRCSNLTQGFWIDEVVSVDTASLPLPDLLNRSAFYDLHPPLYYLVLSLWTVAWDDSEVAVRLLSVIFSAATLLLLAIWARGANRAADDTAPEAAAGRGNGWVAFLSLLLLSLSTFHVHYSSEARAYSMVAFLATAFLYLYSRLLRRSPEADTWVAWSLLGLAETGLLLSHYFAALLVVAVNVHFFTYRRMRRDRLFAWGLVQGLALGFFLLWLPFLLVQYIHLPEGMFAHLRRDSTAVDLLLALGPATVHPSAVVAWTASILVLGAASTRLVTAWRERDRTPLGPRQERAVIPRTASPTRVRVLLGVLLFAIVAPMLSAALIKTSETTLPLLLKELPRCYLVLAASSLLLAGGMLANGMLVGRGHGMAPEPLVFWIAAALSSVFLVSQPMLPRNLIFLLPLLCLVAASAFPLRSLLARVAVVGLVLAMTGPSLLRADTAFEPRQDFRGAAGLVARSSGGAGAESACFVIPMWDRPGIEHYLGQGRAIGLMSPSQIPPASTLPPLVSVVFTRQAFDERRLFMDTIQRRLGPSYRIREGSTFREVFVTVFQKRARSKGASQ
jgi:hypothetical protein